MKAGFHNGWSPRGKSLYEIWSKFFPDEWLSDVCVQKTSESLEAAGDPPITKAELTRYIGLKLLMSTMVVGFSSKEFDERKNPCPLKLNKYMSMRRMERIIDQHLSFTDRAPLAYVDRFWEVRQMQDEWKKNIHGLFYHCWIVCLRQHLLSDTTNSHVRQEDVRKGSGLIVFVVQGNGCALNIGVVTCWNMLQCNLCITDISHYLNLILT